jgi:hypothetical protein
MYATIICGNLEKPITALSSLDKEKESNERNSSEFLSAEVLPV